MQLVQIDVNFDRVRLGADWFDDYRVPAAVAQENPNHSETD